MGMVDYPILHSETKRIQIIIKKNEDKDTESKVNVKIKKRKRNKKHEQAARRTIYNKKEIIQQTQIKDLFISS